MTRPYCDDGAVQRRIGVTRAGADPLEHSPIAITGDIYGHIG